MAAGHELTWLLALRGRKGERPELADVLQAIFDAEMKRSLDHAEMDGKFVKIPAGAFLMGGYEYGIEQPVRIIYLSEYWISIYAETFEEYDAYSDQHGIEKPGDGGWGRRDRPVINVTWEEANAYALSLGSSHALPTEAQWEKAARGALGRKYPWGNSEPDEEKCNFSVPFRGDSWETVSVKSYGPDMHGILQMAGNVWEWCSDRYGAYEAESFNDPTGAQKGENRVLRGGSWYFNAGDCRSAHRAGSHPGARIASIGFRLSRGQTCRATGWDE